MPFPMSQLGRDVANIPAVVSPDDDMEDLKITPMEEGGDTDTDGMQIEEQPDGSAIVKMEEEDEQVDSEFDENLADTLDSHYLSELGLTMVDCVASDMRVREDRDKQYAEGIKRTGLGSEAPGGADFDGASRAVHPMLSKGCVDFGSRAIKELYPAGGPCKTQIIGETTDAKLDRAERKRQYMNWQLTTQVPENRTEFERLLSQLPLGGSQYKRWWWDAEMGRPRTEVVYIDDVFFPYGQEFWTAERVTHRQYITRETYEARVSCGLYIDADLISPPTSIEDMSAAKAASDKVEGASEDSSAYSEEGLRELYQIEANIRCEDDSYADGKSVPYILHVDAWSKRVLGMYRNWSEKDDLRRKKHWMTEYQFIPWRGGPGIGLSHLIGSLAASGTGAVRAILDAALIQNFPGAVMLEGGRQSGQSVQVNPTEIVPIKAPPNVDDIRKLIMQFPFNGPSSVLFQLLEWLTQQAESVVTTASERIAEGGGANMPVGTAMALIESDSANFSAIHARMHASLKQELLILHRLDAENLSDRETVEELGELVVCREDFEGPVDIIPVSDPNIFSEAQRFAQMQALLQVSSDPRFAQFFKSDRLISRLMKLLQIPSPEDIANLPKDPCRLGPLDENYQASLDEPRPLKAYDDQDDIMHLQSHVHYMTSPMFGASPLVGPKALPILISHCKEHLLALYKKHTKAAASAMMTVGQARGITITQEEAESKGSAFADAALAQILGPMIMPGLQQAMQMMQKMQPKPPPSPDVQAREDGETQRLQMQLAADAQDSQADRQANEQAAQLAAQMEAGQQAMEERLGQLTAQLDMIRDDRNNQSRAFIVELQGEQAQAELRLKAFLDAQLAMLPDLSNQVGALDQRTGQVLQDLAGRIQELEQRRTADNSTVVQLLSQIKKTAETPFWRRGTPKE